MLTSEKITSALLIGVVLLASLLTLVSSPITKEEAIEISRNSDLVHGLLEHADRYSLKVYYWNQTEDSRVREEYPWLQEYYPEGRSVWTVAWYIHPENAVSGFALVVSHVIDAETGEILAEGSLSLR